MDKSLIGAAGVYYVAAELSLRGLIALPTIRNTAGIDLVVVNPAGTWNANLQVKTSKNRVSFWPVGTHYTKLSGRDNYYAFVRYLSSQKCFEVFLEMADRVIDATARADEIDRSRGNKVWTSCWHLPRQEDEVKRLRLQWERFGVNFRFPRASENLEAA
jgi:hypothetical protein